MTKRVIASSVAIGLLLLGGVLVADETAAATIVQVSERSISPATVTVRHGDEVIWQARGTAHPQFELTPSAEGVPLRVTETGDFAATFHTLGEYRYVVHVPRGGLADLSIEGKITVK